MAVLKKLEINGDLFTPPKYYAGENVQISPTRVISATDTKYTAGGGINIDEDGVISATGATVPTYTAEEIDAMFADVDAELNGKVGNFSFVSVAVSAGTGVGVTFAGNVGALLFVNSQATDCRGLYLVSRTSSALTHTAVLNGTGIDITPDGSGNNHVILFNNGTAIMRAGYIVSQGSVSIDGQ